MKKPVFYIAVLVVLASLYLYACSAEEPSEPEAVLLPFLPTEKENIDTDIYRLRNTVVSASTIKYELSQEDIDILKKKTDYALRYLNNYYVFDLDEFSEALYDAHSSYQYIQYQQDVADILLQKEDSEVNRRNYLEATSYKSKAWDIFWNFCKVARQDNRTSGIVSDLLNKKYSLVSIYSEGAEKYGYRMVELVTSFNSAKNLPETELCDYYLEYVSTANRYAECFGYENYYEYAAYEVYNRDYDSDAREKIRLYVAEYIVPLYKKSVQIADSLWAEASYSERLISYKYINSNYDQVPNDLFFSYIESLPDSASSIMQGVFDLDRIVVGDSASSNKQASAVCILGDIPFMYFHSDNMDMYTVAHELGHYYSHFYNKRPKDFAYDRWEFYALTNELLLASYMIKNDQSMAFKCESANYISDRLYSWILNTMKDEFDEIVFSTYGSFDPKPSGLLEISKKILEKYGMVGVSTSMENYLKTYWSRQGLDFPAYTMNYSIAFIAAFDIYLQSLTDYQGATELYCNLVENYNEYESFTTNLLLVGMNTPFNKEPYLRLSSLFEN